MKALVPVMLVTLSAPAVADTTYYALVTQAGAPIATSPALTVRPRVRPNGGPGIYEVLWNDSERDITKCAHMVTPRYYNQPMEPSVQGTTASVVVQDPHLLVVFTDDAQGRGTNHGFQLITHCP